MNNEFFLQIPEVSNELIDKMNLNDPVKLLIYASLKTDIPNVYLFKKPIIQPRLPFLFIISGPSGSGKETSVANIEKEGICKRIVSATTRKIRPNENPNDYFWMREKRANETEKMYEENLIKEYELIESDMHHGEVYGLPKSSLNSINSEVSGIIHTENNGAKTLIKELGSKFNIVCIFVIAESYEILWERMKDRNNKVIRLEKSVEEIKDAKNIANYFLLNNSSIEDLQRSMQNLIRIYIKESKD